MTRITPFLWFDNRALEAAELYVSVFPRSKIRAVARYGPGAPGPEGSVMTVSFRLDGVDFTALNGGPVFTFNPAVSFVVTCKTQREIDHYWGALGEGGEPQRCGWLKDRFGVSWQIIPAGLGRLIARPEAMQAMLGMTKLDLGVLERAAAGRATSRPKRRGNRSTSGASRRR